MTPHATSSTPYSCAAPYTSTRSCKVGEPVELLRLPFDKGNLYFVLVNPVFEAPTAEMRAVLPKEVPMKSMINNCCQGGSLVSAGASRDGEMWIVRGQRLMQSDAQPC